ncbi:hypothetical protein ACP275_01G064700 [Erythranthe tilingii]
MGNSPSHHLNGSSKKKETPRRRKSFDTESLPDDLVFEILQHLPAQDIYDSAMLVSKKWHKLINSRSFIYEHLRRSTHGLAIKCYDCKHAVFIETQRSQIKISKLHNHEFGDISIWRSCHGLILESVDSDFSAYTNALHITNHVTKQTINLPTPDLNVIKSFHYNNYDIAYAPASMEYKLVSTYYSWTEIRNSTIFRIFTVGVDELWRFVCIGHLSASAANQLVQSTRFVTEGFIHWADGKSKQILTLNVETEVITETPVPQTIFKNYYLSTGTSSLSLLVSRVDSCSSFEVWEMKSETGEWTKLYDFDTEALRWGFKRLWRKRNHRPFKRVLTCCPKRRICPRLELVPVGWLKYKEVLVLRGSSDTMDYIAYNIRTREIIDFFRLDDDICDHCMFQLHTNSLVRLPIRNQV